MNTSSAEPTQLQLWPDEELPESQKPSLSKEQKAQEEAISEGGQTLAVQLHLPGCEPSL